MGEAVKHDRKEEGARKKHHHHKRPKETGGESTKHEGNIDMVAADKEGLEAEEAEGLPKPEPSKSAFDAGGGLMVTRHVPSILEIRKKAQTKGAAKHKKAKEGGKAPPGASRGQGRSMVSSAAMSPTCLPQEAGGLAKDKTADESSPKKHEPSGKEQRPEPPTTAQDRHTNTDSEREKSEDPVGFKSNPSAVISSIPAGPSNVASMRNALASARKWVYVVAGLAVLVLGALVVLVTALLSHNRTKKAMTSPSTEPSTSPTKPGKLVVEAIGANAVSILGPAHRRFSESRVPEAS